ncbi:hypothetical protein ACLIIZ_03685 [Azonexus caeni]|jgi:hypothetical protein|uniref:hypothetical protein n=1 Tax=Azonexus caeni TaxID=266126 RepID=UPI003A8A36B9
MLFLPLPPSPLQLELNRIEAEAAQHSALICAAASVFESAHQLCAGLNAAADLNPGSLFTRPLEAVALYHTNDVEICIYAGANSAQVIQLALRGGLHLVNHGRSYHDTYRVTAQEYPGVHLFIQAPHANALPSASTALPEAA